MSIHKRFALIASILTALAVSPLAAGKDLLGGASAGSLTDLERQMQANSSEAPAWHTGDGGIYDSSAGRATAAGAPAASGAAVRPDDATGAPPRSDTMRVEPTAPAPAPATGSGPATGYRSRLQ